MRYPGEWKFAGGVVDADETPVQAAMRELEEEFQVKVALTEVWLDDIPEKERKRCLQSNMKELFIFTSKADTTGYRTLTGCKEMMPACFLE